MNRYSQALLLAAAGTLALGMWAGPSYAQTAPPSQPNPAPPLKGQSNPQQKNVPAVSIAFRNDLETPVIVQGHTIVNGMQRRGQPIVIRPDKTSFDNNVPAGFRFVSVFDANQPSRVLVLNFQVPVQGNRDLALVIRNAPKSTRVVLAPDSGQ